MSSSPSFPRRLLGEPWSARLAYFQNYTVAHPRLIETKNKVMAAIQNSAPNSLVFVLGPTGVGKTTLRIKVEQIVIDELRKDLEADLGRFPVISIEAVAPETGTFSWRDHFKRLLIKLDEPLIEYKHDPKTALLRPPSARSNPTTADYRYAVEQALHFRRPTAVMIDEAQHLAKMATGRRLLDQLDVIKSIANQTQTIHVLFGTYDLLAFQNLNGQLSRRSIDVHFPRYRAELAVDRFAFVSILRSFARQLPVSEAPELEKNWEFLYERSVGCVGVLKQWLVRSLCAALRDGEPTLTLQNLERHALSITQADKIFSEASDGEMQLTDSNEVRSRLRERLGLMPRTANTAAHRGSALTKPHLSQPGQRRPMRDPIATPEVLHATRA